MLLLYLLVYSICEFVSQQSSSIDSVLIVTDPMKDCMLRDCYNVYHRAYHGTRHMYVINRYWLSKCYQKVPGSYKINLRKMDQSRKGRLTLIQEISSYSSGSNFGVCGCFEIQLIPMSHSVRRNKENQKQGQIAAQSQSKMVSKNILLHIHSEEEILNIAAAGEQKR